MQPPQKCTLTTSIMEMRSLLHLTYWKQNEWRHGNVLTDTCNTTYRMYWKIKVDAQVETQRTFKSNHGSEAEGRLSCPGTKRLLLFIKYSKMRLSKLQLSSKLRKHKKGTKTLHTHCTASWATAAPSSQADRCHLGPQDKTQHRPTKANQPRCSHQAPQQPHHEPLSSPALSTAKLSTTHSHPH